LSCLDLVGTDNLLDMVRMTANTVPVPPAVWLLGSGLLGIVGIRRRWSGT
jgi:hypothetical protein